MFMRHHSKYMNTVSTMIILMFATVNPTLKQQRKLTKRIKQWTEKKASSEILLKLLAELRCCWYLVHHFSPSIQTLLARDSEWKTFSRVSYNKIEKIGINHMVDHFRKNIVLILNSSHTTCVFSEILLFL